MQNNGGLGRTCKCDIKELSLLYDYQVRLSGHPTVLHDDSMLRDETIFALAKGTLEESLGNYNRSALPYRYTYSYLQRWATTECVYMCVYVVPVVSPVGSRACHINTRWISELYLYSAYQYRSDSSV